MSPDEDTATMEPPPAPTLETSVDRALITMSHSSSNESLVKGWPPTIMVMSVEVPPTSHPIRSPSPIASPSDTHDAAPAAGPANRMRCGASSACFQGIRAAVQSAKFSWPSKARALSPSESFSA